MTHSPESIMIRIVASAAPFVRWEIIDHKSLVNSSTSNTHLSDAKSAMSCFVGICFLVDI